MTPKLTVKVAGRRRSVTLEAIVDTGFDGELSLPIDVATTLGLELVGKAVFELADGSRREELIFSGRARLAGKTKKVKILASISEDTLIGTRFLADCRLTIDFTTGNVRIARKKRGQT